MDAKHTLQQLERTGIEGDIEHAIDESTDEEIIEIGNPDHSHRTESSWHVLRHYAASRIMPTSA